MKAFVSAVIVAVVLAVGMAYVLEGVQRPAEIANTSPTGVRL